MGRGEVVTRPAVKSITQRREEPYLNITSTVLCELGAGNRSGLLDGQIRVLAGKSAFGRAGVVYPGSSRRTLIYQPERGDLAQQDTMNNADQGHQHSS